MAASPRYHHMFTGRYCICLALKRLFIKMTPGVLSTALEITRQVTDHQIHSIQRKLPMYELVLVYKLSEINIVYRIYSGYRLLYLPYRFNHLRCALKR